MTSTRPLLGLAALLLVAGVALLLVPFSTDNGDCGSAALPRYNRASPQADDKWCAEGDYSSRRSLAVWVLVGPAVAVGVVASLHRDLARVRAC